jgi:hypothetical protein
MFVRCVQQIARHIVNVHATADSTVNGTEVQDKENWLKRYVCLRENIIIEHEPTILIWG